MNDKEFINDYLSRYNKSLFENDISDQMIKMKELLLELKNNGKKVIIAGNGGSAAMASHVAVDFTKQGGIRAINFNEADLITCFSNDYGYEHWVSKAIEFYGDEGDLAILISSSGNSENIVNAAKTAKSMGMTVITFTGF
ncbi:MAG: SIS domain-containing protein, partial [Candidatus Marinimicrobia bacterium]|nr:SIS domain-containing protein [Candidatus Neomarinimicrobiota bacterium]